MNQIGTLRHQFLKLDLPIDALPEAFHPMPVFENRRLRSSWGRYTEHRMFGRPTKAFVEIKPETVLRLGLYREVMAHEAAHAVAGMRAGHDYSWRAWCFKLGGTGRTRLPQSAIAGLVVEKPLRVVAVCARCATELRRAKALPSGKQYGHKGCGGRFVAVDSEGMVR